MKKIKLIIFLLLGISILGGPFFSRVAVAYSPEYIWTNANNIDAQDNDNPNNPNSNQTYSFSSKTGKEYKYTISNGGCSYITVQAKSGDAKLYVEKLAGQDCSSGKYNTSSITIKGDLPAEIKQNKDLDASNNNPINCNKNPDDSRCKDQQPADNPCWLSVGTFGWILCPILDFANTLYNWMFGIVRNLLFIPEATYNSNAGLKESWNNMKNIASAIIVLVALVMIAAQIFNFEFISAYTVKKALPRLVIAAIAIQLSWFIFTLLIQITNGVGAGIYNLLTLPFDNAGDILTDLTNQTDSVGYGSQSFGGLLLFLGLSAGTISALITALTPGGWMTLVLVSIGVIVSMLVALITLIVRKMLIITLLILSPVALALWILPGTQRIWSMWWQLFSKLLIMFPLIMILFAAGQIFAASLSNIDESGVVGSVNMIMIIVAFFAPLFLIPGTFKAAGGIFGQIAGFISGSGKKISDGGFGLRRKRDAYRKVSDEMKANELQRKAREVGTSALNPNASKFQRVRGRAQLGVGGFLPGGKDRLSRQVARYGGEIERDELNDAKLEFNARTRDFGSFDDKVKAAAAIAGATGDTATYTRADGKQETIQVNDALRRTAGQFLAEGGAVDEVRAAVSGLKESGRGAAAAKITEDSVGTLIKTAPDLYGKDVDALGHIDLGSVKPGTLRNYSAQLAAWQRAAEDHENNGRFTERDLLLNKIASVSEQADRALTDTNLNISSEMRTTLTAMRDVDIATIDSLTAGKDFAGRDTAASGSGASSKQFLGKPDPSQK
jgi:hypothetical protein